MHPGGLDNSFSAPLPYGIRDPPRTQSRHRFGIRNARRKTPLIQFVERGKIVRLVLSNRHSHVADSMDREGFCRRIFTADMEDSAMLLMRPSSGRFVYSIFRRRLCEP